ncbi:putative signal transduction protein [endosymbiont of Riftia pachyptila (vent Ph05)]|nr:putative signal transduction protein [endosymbiont of Riftia pachyptila (vent Ph05)]
MWTGCGLKERFARPIFMDVKMSRGVWMSAQLMAKERVLRVKHLPPLSATASQLLELLPREDVELKELAEVIGQDPGLTGRLLGLANSAYFALPSPVLTVEAAIIRVLGLKMVKSLAFSIVLAGAFDTHQCPAFLLDRYWYKSLATAFLARRLSELDSGDEVTDPDRAYLCGLLLDLGQLLLAHEFPHVYSQVLSEVERRPELDSAQLERQSLGITAQDAGVWLADRWHLPAEVVAVLAGCSGVKEGRRVPAETPLVMAAEALVLISMRGESFAKLGDGRPSGLPATEQLQRMDEEFVQQQDAIQALAGLLVS